jgi:AraC-like DNA-binding protein
MSESLDILRTVAIVQPVILGLAVLMNRPRRGAGVILSLFAFSIVCHLLGPVLYEHSVPRFILYSVLIGSLAPAPLFWLLTLAVFRDGFRLRLLHVFLSVLAVVGSFAFVLWRHSFGESQAEWIRLILKPFPQAWLVAFVVAAQVEMFRGRRSDLLEWRYRLRYALLFATGMLITIVASVEIALKGHPAPVELEILKMALIVVLSFALQSWLFPLRSDLLGASGDRRPILLTDLPSNASASYSQTDRSGTTEREDILMNALQALMRQEKIYCREGMTIGQLARELKTQEYLLRRLINQRLGFRNFNQFLNHHRVAEAQHILSEDGADEIPIVRIAYDLGYQSLAPFNLAFKSICGMTPSAYRKRFRGIAANTGTEAEEQDSL